MVLSRVLNACLCMFKALNLFRGGRGGTKRAVRFSRFGIITIIIMEGSSFMEPLRWLLRHFSIIHVP